MNFLKSFGALTGASFFSMAANLVRGKLGALFLGPAGVGIFNQLSLSFNVATLAGSLASNNGLIQHGAEALADDDRDAYARLAGTMTIMLAVASLLLTAIGVALARPLSDLLLADGGAHWREVTVMAVGIPIAVAGALYRGLLGGAQAVKAIVAVQISSEFGGALVFALLVVPFGLTGALVGFLSVHLLGALAALAALVRRFGWSSIRPRLSAFDRKVVLSNLGFGASGFIMVGLGNLAILAVTRMVIVQFGLHEAGLLANATRLSNVYLGAVTATALNYFLPAIVRSRDSAAVSAELSRVVRFYALLLPPIMVGIVALAPWIVPLILSRAFLPIVPLLAIFVPFELVRVIGESFTVPLLARRKLVAHTLLFVLQTAVFVGLSAFLLPRFGLMGVAVAYAAGVTAHALASAIVLNRALGVKINRTTLIAVARAITLLSIAMIAAWALKPLQLPLAGGLCVLVLAWLIWRDPSASELRQRLIGSSKAPPA